MPGDDGVRPQQHAVFAEFDLGRPGGSPTRDQPEAERLGVVRPPAVVRAGHQDEARTGEVHSGQFTLGLECLLDGIAARLR